MLRKLAAAAMLLSAATLAAPAGAAMYGGSSSSSSSSTQGYMAPGPMKPMIVPWKRINTKKGRIWADSRGFALYTFAKDAPGRSTCYGPCAVAWPPFYASFGAKPVGKWTLVRRMGMRAQWAYEGHPLYFWFKDKAPGQVTGAGVDGFHVAR
jgi:predicted lipoprotein with Yx(FWY)xxD motif